MKLMLLTALFPLFSYSAPNPSKNKELLKRFYKELYVDWNMETADEMLSPDFISHDWPEKGQKGPKAFRKYYVAFKKAVPDAKYEVKDILADGDRVAVRWEMRGTYSEPFPGIDILPNGQTVILKGVAIYRVEDEKLMERWVVSDLHGLLKTIQEPSK
ncbi:ester cyclase [Olivibacter sp. SDN3]|uniref:ester cyclase n=1 Tax=Olivibacter sp. SDN3 TaxID=2764720 RepID=UPI0016517F9F|nr:ester cyclase [Olivibacter sp. SDN3]QNL51870.1 ester cyclase [Olivibacter sp. SDN3]